jgi:hypothetical protein
VFSFTFPSRSPSRTSFVFLRVLLWLKNLPFPLLSFHPFILPFFPIFPNFLSGMTLSKHFRVFLRALALLVLLAPASVFAGNGPKWWTERGVVNSSKPANDYAAATRGQLKNFTLAAALELDTRLSGGAGAAINNLLDRWAPKVGGVRTPVKSAANQSALTLGELKTVGELFYARLQVAGVIAIGVRPWTQTGAHSSHAAVANLGQLKTVFSFRATKPNDTEDSDGDGLRDAWELQHFGNLSRAGGERLTPGGLRVRDAQDFGLDPNTLVDGTGSREPNGTTANPNGLAPEGIPQTDIFTYDSRGWLASAQLGSGAKRAHAHDSEGNIANAQNP